MKHVIKLSNIKKGSAHICTSREQEFYTRASPQEWALHMPFKNMAQLGLENNMNGRLICLAKEVILDDNTLYGKQAALM